MSNDNVAFRSSFRGYNKKDVYKYLETLNRDIAKKNTELEMELSGLKDKNAKLIAECTYASNELEQLKAQQRDETEKLRCEISKKDGEILRINNDLEQKNSELVKLKTFLEQKDNELCRCNESLAQKEALIDELDSATVKISLELDALGEEYAQLVSKYEQLSSALKDIDSIKRKAQAYDKISMRVKEYSRTNASIAQDAVKDTPANEAKAPSEDIKSGIDDILNGSAEEILSYIQSTQARFNSAILSAQSETDALKERINSVIKTSKEKIISQIKNS